MPYLLSPGAVARTALAEWDHLAVVRGKTQCRYTYRGNSRCIIGLALPKDILKQIKKQGLLTTRVLALPMIQISDPLVQGMQEAHDRIIRKGSKGWKDIGQWTTNIQLLQWLAGNADKPCTIPTLHEFVTIISTIYQ